MKKRSAIVFKILKKLRMNKIVFLLLKPIIQMNGKRKRNKYDDFDWREYLTTLHPDIGGFSLWENKMTESKEIDLDIIIPVYNVEPYVEESIKSALNQQTKYKYRLIIVNDGSTDGSLNIVNQFASCRNVLIINQTNKGLSSARNVGLQHCQGKYVAFLDSDDRLTNDFVEVLMNEAYANDYDIVGGGFIRFKGDKYGPKITRKTNKVFGYAWGKVYKSSIFERICFPDKYWFEDTVFNLVLHDLPKRIKNLDRVVLEHRANPTGITHTSIGNPKIIDTVWVTLKLLHDREEINLPFDDKFVKKLLHQIWINTVRIHSLKDKRADYANFMASVEIMRKYYPDERSIEYDDEKQRQITTAIYTNNFRLFMLANMLL